MTIRSNKNQSKNQSTVPPQATNQEIAEAYRQHVLTLRAGHHGLRVGLFEQPPNYGSLIEEVIDRLRDFGVEADYGEAMTEEHGLYIDALEVKTKLDTFVFRPFDDDGLSVALDLWVGKSERGDIEPVVTTVDINEHSHHIVAVGIYYALLNRDLLTEDHDRKMQEFNEQEDRAALEEAQANGTVLPMEEKLKDEEK